MKLVMKFINIFLKIFNFICYYILCKAENICILFYWLCKADYLYESIISESENLYDLYLY